MVLNIYGEDIIVVIVNCHLIYWGRTQTVPCSRYLESPVDYTYLQLAKPEFSAVCSVELSAKSCALFLLFCLCITYLCLYSLVLMAIQATLTSFSSLGHPDYS